MIDAAKIVGTHDIVFITLDTLRYDVATQAIATGRTPFLQNLLPNGNWEKRHTPGSFTYAAHHAFFAGFLPTPDQPGLHPRLFATEFQGSESTVASTAVFDAPDIVSGLAAQGYKTVCIGGVGFFNKQTPLSTVFPDLFEESYWNESFGVADLNSTENQVAQACKVISDLPLERKLFLFMNISAIHQPNCIYSDQSIDSAATQLDALAYVDRSIQPLFNSLAARAPVLCIICSDHGTAYGENGFHGHRLAHDVVWNVPYTEFIWNPA